MSPSITPAGPVTAGTTPGLDPGLALEIVVQDPSWPAPIVDQAACDRIARAISRLVAFERTERAVVAFSSDRHVQGLNLQYRGKDRPTNVLSFPAPEPVATGEAAAALGGAVLGDIVLARETIVREAVDQAVSEAHHAAHLIVHGILHLLGYDHEDEVSADEMEALEIDILADLGIANPYQEELDDVD